MSLDVILMVIFGLAFLLVLFIGYKWKDIFLLIECGMITGCITVFLFCDPGLLEYIGNIDLIDHRKTLSIFFFVITLIFGVFVIIMYLLEYFKKQSLEPEEKHDQETA